MVLLDHACPHYLYNGYITGAIIIELTLYKAIENNKEKKTIYFIILFIYLVNL